MCLKIRILMMWSMIREPLTSFTWWRTTTTTIMSRQCILGLRKTIPVDLSSQAVIAPPTNSTKFLQRNNILIKYRKSRDIKHLNLEESRDKLSAHEFINRMSKCRFILAIRYFIVLKANYFRSCVWMHIYLLFNMKVINIL